MIAPSRILALLMGCSVAILVASCSDGGPTEPRNSVADSPPVRPTVVASGSTGTSGDFYLDMWVQTYFNSADHPADGGVGGATNSGPGSGGSSGSSASSPIREGACDPRLTGCLQPLRASDSASISSALTNVKDTSSISDPMEKAQCANMTTKLAQIFHANNVFRGNPAVGNGNVGDHGATYYQGEIHVDQKFLDGVKAGTYSASELASALLHEAAHALGFNHEPVTVSPHTYMEEYFKYTNYNDPSSCVSY